MSTSDKPALLPVTAIVLFGLAIVFLGGWKNEQEANQLWQRACTSQSMAHAQLVEKYHAASNIINYSKKYGIDAGLAANIIRISEKHSIPVDKAFRLIFQESRFQETAVSYKGAIGLTQVRLPTARSVRPGIKRNDLFDPETNLSIGFAYLQRLYQRFGNWKEALISYHRGPTRMVAEARSGKSHGSSHRYAESILR